MLLTFLACFTLSFTFKHGDHKEIPEQDQKYIMKGYWVAEELGYTKRNDLQIFHLGDGKEVEFSQVLNLKMEVYFVEKLDQYKGVMFNYSFYSIETKKVEHVRMFAPISKKYHLPDRWLFERPGAGTLNMERLEHTRLVMASLINSSMFLYDLLNLEKIIERQDVKQAWDAFEPNFR